MNSGIGPVLLSLLLAGAVMWVVDGRGWPRLRRRPPARTRPAAVPRPRAERLDPLVAEAAIVSAHRAEDAAAAATASLNGRLRCAECQLGWRRAGPTCDDGADHRWVDEAGQPAEPVHA